MNDTRKAFEDFIIVEKGYTIKKNYGLDGMFFSYIRDDVQDCWEAWQAAINSIPAAKQEPVGEAYGYVRKDNVDLGEVIKGQWLNKDKVEPDDVAVFLAQPDQSARIAELEAEIERYKAYAAHERSLGAEPFLIENTSLKQQIAEFEDVLIKLKAMGIVEQEEIIDRALAKIKDK